MLLLLFAACSDDTPAPEPPPEERRLDGVALQRAFPAEKVKDRAGWAADLARVFEAHGLPPTVRNACEVTAVLEQESGYVADPAVPGLGGMVDAWIEEKQADMGAVPAWAFGQTLHAVLDEKPQGAAQSFNERLHAAKTEHDVDRTFRDFVAYQRSLLPAPLRAAESVAQVVGLDLDELNPITTAGCMQVKVDFAEEHARHEGGDVSGVREALYTRAGCLHYGVVRLLGDDATYDKPLYRFADFNAGSYASRNAAFQEMISALTATKLALDGDLVRYTPKGAVAGEPSRTETVILALVAANGLDLSPSRVRRDLSREKEAAFEQTETWTQLRALYTTKTGLEPHYARMPDVHLDSLKLRGDKTTGWYAQSVQRRYDACVTRVIGKKI